MDKKYEIIKNGIDDYSLKYKDKEIRFKSNVGIVNDMQEANKNARINMIMDLTRKGMSLKQFVKEEKKDGKTYYDNTNKRELENIYIDQETGKVFINKVEEMLNINYQELIQDIGLKGEEEIIKFNEDLGKAMLGIFPS